MQPAQACCSPAALLRRRARPYLLLLDDLDVLALLLLGEVLRVRLPCGPSEARSGQGIEVAGGVSDVDESFAVRLVLELRVVLLGDIDEPDDLIVAQEPSGGDLASVRVDLEPVVIGIAVRVDSMLVAVQVDPVRFEDLVVRAS